MARLRRGRLRWAVAGGLVIALVAAAVVAWPYAQRYTGSAPPPQFYDKVQLGRRGVDGITTDNLAILRALGLPAPPA